MPLTQYKLLKAKLRIDDDRIEQEFGYPSGNDLIAHLESLIVMAELSGMKARTEKKHNGVWLFFYEPYNETQFGHARSGDAVRFALHFIHDVTGKLVDIVLKQYTGTYFSTGNTVTSSSIYRRRHEFEPINRLKGML